MADMLSSETASTVAAATGVVATIAGAILVPIRWVQGVIRAERDERIKADKFERDERTKADDALRADIEGHRRDEIAYQQRTSDRLAEVATKADLSRQTDLILGALKLRATLSE